MPVIIALLRGVNVGGHNKLKMDAFRALCQSLGLGGVQTYVQSGNVVFQTGEKNLVRLSNKIQGAIAKQFGFRPDLMLRTLPEWRRAIAANPFARRTGLNPAKLNVLFLAGRPSAAAEKNLSAFKDLPEELHLLGRELFIYFPRGMGQSKLPWTRFDRLLETRVTARNWNTVTKLLEMAESLESSA